MSRLTTACCLPPNALRYACRLALTLAFAASVATAQSPTDGMTPSGLAPGAPAGSYQLSGLDTVNYYNGHLNFSLPLLKVNGRGGAQMNVMLPIEQTWRAEKQWENEYVAVPGSWRDGVPLDLQGFSAGSLMARMAGTGLDYWPCPGHIDPVSYYGESLTRLTFTSPDGTEFEMRDLLTGGKPASQLECRTTGFNRGRVFVTADGTSATFVSDDDVLDDLRPGEGGQASLSGYLFLRDGTRFRISFGGFIRWMRDRNGNTLTFEYYDGNSDAPPYTEVVPRTNISLYRITDSLGRTITFHYDLTNAQFGLHDTITYKGVGETARIIRVAHRKLNERLRDGFTIKSFHDLFPQLNASSYTNYDPYKVSAVWLPDGIRSYQFRYNSHGELAEVTLPTGGMFRYDHDFGFGPSEAGQHTDYTGAYRRLVARYEYANGAALTGRMTVSRTEYVTPSGSQTPMGYVAVAHFDASGPPLASEKHYYYGNPMSTIVAGAVSGIGYSGWKEGREYKTEAFDGAGLLLRRVEQEWSQRAAVGWWCLLYFGSTNCTADNAPSNDPRIVETTTTLADTNLVTKQSFAYDGYNNQTDVWEYDYGAGVPGPLLRHTQTAYVTTNNGVNYAALNPTISAPDVNATYHLRGLPARQSVYDAAGAERSRAVYEYDNYNPDANHAALLARTGIVGLCDATAVVNNWAQCVLSNPTAYSARGNVTAVTRYADAAGHTGAVTTFAQYDVAGNVVAATDARSNTSTVSYSDVFSDGLGRNTYAFATGTTSAVPAPSPGPYAGHGSVTPLTTSAVYDYWTGLLTSSTDANGKVTSYEYEDPLDRLTKVNRPDGGWATYWYDRNAYGEYVGTRSAINSSQQTEGYQFFDGLGRGARSFQYDGTNWITSDTQYDAMGRAWRVSAEPYLSGGSGSLVNPSERWVESTFDALGRATHVKTTADGAQVTTVYNGNTVTVTDQAGKSRKSVSDALGRLTQIVEAPGVGSCQPDGSGCATDYSYDAPGNLRKVAQGTQIRYFMYDSLGRLVRAKQPEQGVNPSLALTDTYKAPGDQFPNSQWTVGYSYDANSNLHQRTDARNVTTTYGHDNLNRGTTVDYSDTTSINPDVSRYYDNPAAGANGLGRFWFDYAGGDYAAGQTVEQSAVNSYDEAGRPLVRRQQFKAAGVWSDVYQTSRQYNRAGAAISQTYPSGHTVSYNYDAAGRLADGGTNAAFSGNLGDGVQRAYASQIAYDGAGRMRQERFGTETPLYHKRHHNARGQLYDARLSTVEWQPSGAGEWDWNRGLVAAWYGNLNTSHGGSSSDNNGNVVRAHSSVPLNDQISEYSYHEQRYTYDALNRLSTFVEMAGSHAATPGPHAAQSYAYDRWGNRQIDAAGTWLGNSAAPPDPDINETQFGMEAAAASNRLLAPGDAPLAEAARRMRYDAAGNLTNDTYTGSGGRTYDAENRMTSAWGHSATLGGPFQNRYVYDAAGKRVRRKTDAGEAWQVYGFEGELIAEYAAAGAPAQPQKEYGYRGGELLVVAEAGGAQAQPVAWQSAVGVSVSGSSLTRTGASAWDAGASSQQSIPSGDGYFEFTAANVSARMAGLSNGDSHQSYTDIDFAVYPNAGGLVEVWEAGTLKWGGSVSYQAGDRFRVAVEDGAVKYYKISGGVMTHLYTSAVTPTYPLLADAALCFTGAQVADAVIAGGGYSADAASSFSAAQNPSGEWAYGYRPSGGQFTTLPAASTYFGAGTQTWALPGQPCCPMVTRNTTGSTLSYPAAPNVVQPPDTLNLHPGPAGERGVVRWTAPAAGTYTFAGRFQGIDTYGTTSDVRIEHNGATVFTGQVGGYGAQAPFNLPLTVAAGDKVEFSVGFGANGNYDSDSTGLAVAVAGPGAASQPTVRWLVSDHLGTPRITADLSGSLDGITRHDYLPFGEEIGAGVGGRTTDQGYGPADNVRQKFTGYERDSETGLDYAQARYFANQQGRFTGVDPLLASGRPAAPQTWNRYAYALNNPLRLTDPTGLSPREQGSADVEEGLDNQQEQRREGQQQTEQRRGTILIIVGDPGLGEHNAGTNFDRVAETKRANLTAQGYTVIVQRASGAADFAAALTNNGTLDGVEYVGHATFNKLYVGEQSAPDTNIDFSNVSQLSNANLSANAYVKLNACFAGDGGEDSIAAGIANQLRRTTLAFDGGTVFSGMETRRTARGNYPPSKGPLYLIEDRGSRLVTYTPRN